MKINIFISHADKEKNLAAALKADLSSPFDVFLAHDDISGGRHGWKGVYEKCTNSFQID